MDTAVMVLVDMNAENFHYQLVSRVKMSLFFIWTIVSQCFLIIEEYIS